MMRIKIALTAAFVLATFAQLAPCRAQDEAHQTTGAATVSPLKMMRNPIGDRIPDAEVVDDTGRQVRFFTDLVKDRAVVISFFYTNCRGTCPGTNLVLADLRQILARDFGRSVRLISISIEPEKDDVPAIAEYAAQFRTEATDADTPEWVFLTGEPDTIRNLRRKLGYYDIDDAVDRDPTQHAAALIVGNHATGRWGIMPVGLGAERLATKVRTLAGWTSAQRYAVVERPNGPERDQAEASAADASDAEAPTNAEPRAATPAATAAPKAE